MPSRLQACWGLLRENTLPGPRERQTRARITKRAGLGLAVATLIVFIQSADSRLQAQCGSNPVVCENALTGDPASAWDITGAGDSTLQGFATDISVNKGGTVAFKVTTTAATFKIDIYRLGYYGGLGARRVATISNVTGKVQSACLTVSATGLIDCGNWTQSASWAVPSTAVSGIYLAKLSRADSGGASHIVFVVRDDASTSDLLYKTSDTTWQAYNDYGGNSLYTGAPGTNPNRAYKVSYNRPFSTRGNQYSRAFLFGPEYPMVRWLEANGYNVSYLTSVDADRSGALLLQHKTLLSVGHDEYWSGQERTNVEAARAAGKNLAFFSGNEMFWKTRWEASVDGSNTAYRTLVSYKETHANAPIDPLDPTIWTGTWRDPRFSPPADGGRPENALTGTIYRQNCCQTSAVGVGVSGAVAGFRFWRNTLVAQLGPAQTAQIAPGIVGYEVDSDVDNGFRPQGLVDLSSISYASSQLLQDYGSTYAAGTMTHNVTQYRHSSGALVFGAGTIRWSWGLDPNHDLDSASPAGPTSQNVTIAQATVNLLADMGAQPGTLQPGLSPATPSSDVLPPTSVITSPANGALVPAGAPLTITGTASDAGGGTVALVEVSTDGGTTWAPAIGQGSWTYTWTPAIVGTTSLFSRSTDDSGNVETPTIFVPVTVAQTNCPCTIWNASATPALTATSDSSAVELGVRFRADANGLLTGVRFYKAPTNTGTHTGSLWSNTGTLLATATFVNETASGWQQVTFPTPVALTANTTYVASYHTNIGNYGYNSAYFAAAGVDSPPLHALATGVDGGNGVYVYGASAFPLQTYNANNYWVDVTFTPVADTTAPTVTARTPASNATGVSPATTVTATFSEAVNATTLTTSNFVLRNPSNVVVPGTVNYNVITRVATLTPSQALASSTVYTATLVGGSGGVMDVAGNPLASNVVWSFTTAADTTPPTVTNVTPASGATGVSAVTAVTATFSEAMTASTITTTTFRLRNPANTIITSTVAYNATTRVATLTPSAALAGSTTYTATITGGSAGVKDSAGNALASNLVWSFTTSAADTTPPTVVNTTPINGAVAVNAATAIAATFSEPMTASTVTTGTFVVRDAANVLVPGTVGYNVGTNVATLTPSQPLAAGTTYSATMSGGSAGAKDLAGNALASNYVWSFATTAAPASFTIWNASAVPAQIDTDPNPVELGVRFRSDLAGTITGVRFYKGAANTGTHVGALWTNTGTQLAMATFTNETESGWQEVTFATPVAVTANTTYVASYHTTVGNYAVNNGFFGAAGVDNPPLHALATGIDGSNGVYSYGPGSFPSQTFNGNNYWVDVVFTTTADITAPTVSNQTPAGGATNVVPTTSVAATFSEPMDVTTVNATTFVLRDSSNSLVASSVGYNVGTRVVTLTPSQALLTATTYTATISGGAAGAKDAAGNALASNVVWSFTTAAETTPPTVTGATPANGATGVGIATSVTATFSEAIDQATLNGSTFVLRTPTNTVVASTIGYNAGTNVATLTPLSALAGSTTYTATVTGGSAGVKDLAGNALVSNYVWSFTTADVTPPSVVGNTPASGATGVSTATSVTATFSEAMTAATVTTTTFVLRTPANTLVPATVSYNGSTNVATLTPSSALGTNTTYTATITGGSAGVKDVAGNALVSDYVWSFTTGATNPPAGLTTIGSTLDSGDSNFLNGSIITTTTGGPVSSMSVYVGPIDTNSANRLYQVAIYTNSAGKPGTLVATSASGTLTANAWNTLALSATLQPGTSYWLLFNTNGRTDAVNNMYYNVSTAGQGVYSNAGVTFGSWPATFPASTLTTAKYSLYATFAP